MTTYDDIAQRYIDAWNQARFGWERGPAGSPAPIVGFDVAVTDDAGRIRTVLGFLDKVPPWADLIESPSGTRDFRQ